jgi:hypothetical protein
VKWLGLLALAACYAPTIAEEVPCGTDERCPAGQQCYAGICRSSPPAQLDAAIDAPPDTPPDAAFTCGGADSVLSSPCAETFSGQGVYFDLVAKQTIGITGFSTMTQNAGTRDMAIYYRNGTHVGFEGNAAGWTLLGTTSGFTPTAGMACPLTPTLVPITFCLEIAQGERVAFYVTTAAGTGSLETFNRAVGQVVVENADLVLYAGRLQQGAGTFAGTIVDGKGFQGVVHTSR